MEKFNKKMDALLLNFATWAIKSIKLIVYVVLVNLVFLVLQILYMAFTLPKPFGLPSTIFLCVVAGILLFFALVGFRHREKIWS